MERTRMKTRRWTKLGLLCAAVLVVVALALPASSLATDGGWFCGTPTSYYTIAGGGGKCIHNVYHTVYADIDGYIPGSYPANYDLCSIAKQHYASGGGTGANTMPLACSGYSASNAISYCSVGYACNGYAELINYGPTGGFYGQIHFP